MLRCVGRTGVPQNKLKPGAEWQRQLTLAFRLQGPLCPKSLLRAFLDFNSVAPTILCEAGSDHFLFLPTSSLSFHPYLPSLLLSLLPPLLPSLFFFFFHSIAKKEESIQYFLRSHGSKWRTRCKPRSLSSLVSQGLESFRRQGQGLERSAATGSSSLSIM